jgi:hypothetical protein
VGPLLTNRAVDTTYQIFANMEQQASPQTKLNWRFQQALYRAYYDSYVRDRLIYETALETQAMEALALGRGANRDTIDVSLNNRLWLADRFSDIQSSLVGFAMRGTGSIRGIDPGYLSHRISWRDHAEALFDAPLQLRYTNLDPDAQSLARGLRRRQPDG